MLDLKKYRGARLLLLLPLLLIACTYTLKIKDGRTAYERKQYAVAAPMLEKEFGRAKTRTEKGQLAFLLGDAYRRNGQDEQALPWFKTAYDNNYGAEALKAYAYGLKKLERYAEARDAFKDLGIEIGSPYEYRKEITATTIAEGWKKELPSNGWSAEGAPFNSAQNDFAPVRYADGRLVFTSDRAMSAGEDAYGWTGNRFMDLFIVEPGGASAQVFDSRLNSPANEGTACFNAAFTEIFFVRALGAYKGDDAYCKIYSAEQNGGAWSDPKPLPFQKEKVNYLHPALSADGMTLFFASNDPEGLGGYDLYAVAREPRSENGWGEPRILSRNLNTTANEVFPTVEADTLYFSSDGLPGMGGLDIFRTYRSDRGAWSPPINLKAPVNSGADEFAFTVNIGGAAAEARSAEDSQPSSALRASAGKPGDLLRSGFFTSNRPGGRGGDDIYRFEQRVPPPAPPRRDTTPARPLAYKMVLEGYVLEKIYTEAENPNSKVLARRPLGGATVLIDAAGKKQTVTVKDDGFFSLELEENSDYTFTASQPGYLANSTRFSTRGIARDPAQPVQTFEVEIVLDKIFRDREIVLENIYYDYDKWDIRPDAEPTLNRLADVLRQNPGVRIQLGSHTDCRGNDDYNRDLAQKRAESAVNYLIAKGIEASRLSALGYGESQPAADCACARCTEADHQANRRTTFKVMEGGAGF
jgi:peptidoglycan-associated lipoprotein